LGAQTAEKEGKKLIFHKLATGWLYRNKKTATMAVFLIYFVALQSEKMVHRTIDRRSIFDGVSQKG
jgi:hypothetical protein